MMTTILKLDLKNVLILIGMKQNNSCKCKPHSKTLLADYDDTMKL